MKKLIKLPIYFDYASTTPIDPEVTQSMIQYLGNSEKFGNSSSRSHQFGWHAEEAIDIARNQVADLIHVNTNEIFFTSGATESNNLAIKGLAYSHNNKKKHIITSSIEHKSVINTCLFLEKKGFNVTYIKPLKNGLIDIKEIKKSIKEDTFLVSIMEVNNEIGVIQDISAIGKICKKNHIYFHVDATQSIGKFTVDLRKKNIDLMSFSAHKFYGPKGVGVLYIRQNLHLIMEPLIHGGGQEKKIRSGTLATHQIVGIGKASEIIQKKKFFSEEKKRLKKFHDILFNKIKNIKNISFNGDLKLNVPSIINICFFDVKKTFFVEILKTLSMSYGSACNSSVKKSHVLKAMGLNEKIVNSSLRFSFGRFTTEEEINYATKFLKKNIVYFYKKN
ncbi:cysteine desulfurase family protein [Candidatus Tachikawaea gelatinosa]|uniref:cysteine desulfurase n=1 Tax=Candidatus Tachikawaea gelatinosa TaxID=1410383 RepID=A0A090AQ33_9ENTR|nr:aminotransferase class V-fold PLP-dependent enzyme [Candidatus Tachikawaea gelatinosa]BAP58442.1 cysteine desulfurase [Candidatus Tachikawaea gelatinosa]